MASDGGAAANVEENILYDLTIHSEWPQEPEITVRESLVNQNEYFSWPATGCK